LIQIYNYNAINSTRVVEIGDSILNTLKEHSLTLDYVPTDKEIIQLSYKAIKLILMMVVHQRK